MIRWTVDPPSLPWFTGILSTPVGPLCLIFTPSALVGGRFDLETDPKDWFGRLLIPSAIPHWIRRLVVIAFTRSLGLIDWPLVDPGLTPFQRLSLSRATQIPFGTLVAYSQLAAAIGYPGRARAVGRAMSLSPIPLLIPTHRVVRADGRPALCQQTGVAARLRRYERTTSSLMGRKRDRRTTSR